ncbi:MAG TPA: septation protein SepH [Kribbella sp.]|uniref:septation protein SepH n=1 Tax=Kribbella sp. TaxID=1871183 RepID=UPI002D78D64B|nr:septation protein SepH [Kribbella sp.]HET6292978.1 septation protein SepH [Kribbella sp.]
MREARLVGLSQDGKQLILALAETGEEFAIPVDDRLRAALRGDRARLGQLEIQMESALRPRDIQARIRAGESPEAVAAVAQMPMERVMAFAGPVLAERDHVANLAQRASVRRRGGGDAPTRNLGAWVTERLRTRQVDPASAEWDAWRRDDGRWAVRVSYFAESEDEKVAMFAYDAPGRYAVPDDDEARWLVGEQAQVIAPPTERRLTAVADFDLSLAPDHGADSYEAGFEDTISLPRGRAHQSDRDANRDTGRGFGRELERETGRDFSRGPGRDAGHDSPPGVSREVSREVAREVSRDVERGPRRVHSVPSPDDEPTLIDVPVEQPPALRPAVRAVERSAQLPVDQPPMTPPEERAAAPKNRFTERQSPDNRQTDARQEAVPDAAPAAAAPRPADPRRDDAAARAAAPRPADPRQFAPKPADPRPEPLPESSPAPSDAPVEAPAAQDGAEQPAAAEPKKKATKRGSKRASVPSWDEIMFGKKAD